MGDNVLTNILVPCSKKHRKQEAASCEAGGVYSGLHSLPRP